MTSANTQYAKSGDGLPIFAATLRDGNGTPIDLLNTYNVLFKLRARDALATDPTYGGEATVVQPDIDIATDPDNVNLGAVTYALDTSITLAPNVYYAEWTMHTPSGRDMTFPDSGYDIVYISRRLPNPA